MEQFQNKHVIIMYHAILLVESQTFKTLGGTTWTGDDVKCHAFYAINVLLLKN